MKSRKYWQIRKDKAFGLHGEMKTLSSVTMGKRVRDSISKVSDVADKGKKGLKDKKTRKEKKTRKLVDHGSEEVSATTEKHILESVESLSDQNETTKATSEALTKKDKKKRSKSAKGKRISKSEESRIDDSDIDDVGLEVMATQDDSKKLNSAPLIDECEVASSDNADMQTRSDEDAHGRVDTEEETAATDDYSEFSKSVKISFNDMNLSIDNRLNKALMKCGFVYPTAVQVKALPLALEGKDMLVRGRTGSGKTLTYLVPLLNKILLRKKHMSVDDPSLLAIRAIVLVPTRELVAQVHSQCMALMYYCKDVLRCVSISNEKLSVQKSMLKSLPDVLISTPGRLAQVLGSMSSEKLSLGLKETVEFFVIDEADLIFSFGYAEDLKSIIAQLARTVQSMLISATLNDDVASLKDLVLHDPAIVKVDANAIDGTLVQWYCSVKEDDKDLLLFALIRLKLISGKALFFVNSVERAYYVKLLFEQFHVKSAVLNAELPVNSRLHILQQFNRGMFDYLIATDSAVDVNSAVEITMEETLPSVDKDLSESPKDNDGDSDSDSNSENSNSESALDDSDSSEDESQLKSGRDQCAEETEKGSKNEVAKSSKSLETDEDKVGVSRGVDFEDVTTVVNIDMPTSFASYTHRIGRTARGGRSGISLSIVSEDCPNEVQLLEEIQRDQALGEDGKPSPGLLALDINELAGFRYRVEGTRRMVTKKAIKEARLRELRQEMLNSEKLKNHFEENPVDLELIRHDLALRPQKVKTHMATIPEYLLPNMLQEQRVLLKGRGPVKIGSSTAGRVAWKRRHKVGKFRDSRGRKKKSSKGSSKNPLF